MQQPILNPVPFATNGQKNTIPDNAGGNNASFNQGFPAITMMPINQGGMPPSGQDFNGILNHLDQHIVWLCAGMGYSYNIDFANAIGGYPKGAVVRSSDKLSAYVSLADGNTTDPDSQQSKNWQIWAGLKMIELIGKPSTTPTTGTPTPTGGTTTAPVVYISVSGSKQVGNDINVPVDIDIRGATDTNKPVTLTVRYDYSPDNDPLKTEYSETKTLTGSYGSLGEGFYIGDTKQILIKLPLPTAPRSFNSVTIRAFLTVYGYDGQTHDISDTKNIAIS